MPKLTTQHIERCGELLVQYRLLKYGIDSSAMTIDDGIDLVAYEPTTKRATTIQVKTNEKPKCSGGKGKLTLDWWIRENSPAELVALVHMADDEIWLFTHQELSNMTIQKSNGKLHPYFYIDDNYKTTKAKTHKREFSPYLIENRVGSLFRI
jgi:hypothetical protein